MTTLTQAGCAPRVAGEEIVFSLPDPHGELSGVRLYQEIQRPRDGLALERVDDCFQLRFPVPPAWRMEYAFIVERADGSSEFITDPSNPQVAPGPFGAKSVVELPGYLRPSWLDDVPPPMTIGGPASEAEADSELLTFDVPAKGLGTDLRVHLWSGPGVGDEEPVPLLVVHDGPEYAEYSALLRFLRRMVLDGRLPPLRAALLPPVEGRRDEDYSASTRYAKALATAVLPAIGWMAPHPDDMPYGRIAMGASLGALALLHVHRLYPGALDGLYLQSGSYFRQRFDPQESGFPRFRRITRFVGEVLRATAPERPIPVRLTCGTVEENFANNRAVAHALVRQRYPADLVEHPDGHTYVSWRDTLDPHLVDFLAPLWTQRSGSA